MELRRCLCLSQKIKNNWEDNHCWPLAYTITHTCIYTHANTYMNHIHTYTHTDKQKEACLVLILYLLSAFGVWSDVHRHVSPACIFGWEFSRTTGKLFPLPAIQQSSLGNGAILLRLGVPNSVNLDSYSQRLTYKVILDPVKLIIDINYHMCLYPRWRAI